MPGDDQASLTAHPRALDLFTDRLSERRRFAHYLHSRPPEPRPIFFHGDGGTGKSLLLKHLRAQFCRLLPPDEWAHCDGQPDTRVGHQACLDAYRALVGADGSGDSIKVPCIWHDFAATDASEGNPQDAWPALLMLRKQLTKSGFKLPTFDYAVTRWLRATDRLSADQLKQLLPVEELDALGAGVDFLTADQGPILNLLARGLEVVAPDWQGNLQLLLAQRGIDAATRKRLDTLFDTDRDPSALDNALNALPRLFANDLNVWMQRPGAVPRLVLLFDTHEAFWGGDREQSRSRQSYFDEDAWLRRLVNGLYPIGEPNRGIVVVIAGREPPRWAEAVADKIEAERIDCQLVGHWGRADARDYLCRALAPANFTDPAEDCGPLVVASAADQPNPAQDEALIEAMIRSAEVAEDQVHPLYLGLAADIFCLANKRGQRLTAAAFAVAPEHTDHRAAMVERLLRYCPEAVAHAVKALAAARGFDEALFYALGERLHFRHERPDFETLTRFSFCWTSPERDRYRIHDLLRRLLAEEDPAQMQQAHAALEAIYRERAETEPVAIAEVIYHANRQNWERGYNEWTAIMRESVNGACYGVAQALTDIRVALTLKTDLSAANVAWLTGESAGFLQDNRLAEQTLRDAIMHCDDALQSDSNLLDALDLKGSAQFRLGDLRVRLDDKARADVDYREAIFSFDKALEIDPTFAPARAHKGIGLAGLAASISNSDPDAAVQFFNASIAEFETALKLTPRDARFHYNRGNVLRFLGDHLMAHGDDGGAISAYQSAVHGFDNTLKVDPNHVFANPTKAGALVGLGMIFSKTGHNSDAKIAFLEAVAACDETLKIAPEYVVAHNNKGSALNKLGALYVSLGDLPAAKSAYEKSIEALDAALRRTSSDALVLSNKGKTLHQLGALLLNQEAMALGCAVLSESEVILTQASSLAPTDESLIVELRLVQDLITQRCISHG